MTFKTLTILAASVTALGVSACTSSTSPAVLAKAPGTYEHTTNATNSNGTDVKKTTTTDVGYDANGHKKAVVKTTTTKDPKGLFNKSTSTSTTTVK